MSGIDLEKSLKKIEHIRKMKELFKERPSVDMQLERKVLKKIEHGEKVREKQQVRVNTPVKERPSIDIQLVRKALKKIEHGEKVREKQQVRANTPDMDLVRQAIRSIEGSGRIRREGLYPPGLLSRLLVRRKDGIRIHGTGQGEQDPGWDNAVRTIEDI